MVFEIINMDEQCYHHWSSVYPAWLSDTPSWLSAIALQCQWALWLTAFICLMEPQCFCSIILYNLEEKWGVWFNSKDISDVTSTVMQYLWLAKRIGHGNYARMSENDVNVCEQISSLFLQFWQFVKDRVRLLECSCASCLAPWNHCEEKHEKFITRRINNKSLSTSILTHAEVSNIEKHNFSFRWMKNSFSRGKMSSFERNTNLSHLPGTLKVYGWLTYPFLFNNITLFISRSTQLACFAENRDLLGFLHQKSQLKI